VGGHGDAARSVEFEAEVGVAHVEVNGRSDWSGRVSVVDDYVGDVPG
jgi:hypothetical protein